jgi:16S rRNA (cytidine1402-2'-O)-methyltransferase
MTSLILLPNVLHDGDEDTRSVFPPIVQDKVISIKGLIAENEKEARRFLKRFTFPEGRTFREIPIKLLNEHTKPEELEDLLKPLLDGETWGLISDAGLPCLADPGANLVALARRKGVKVEAVPGPSSLFLALMLSGLSAQSFTFHGYLERDLNSKELQIKELEKTSAKLGQTQLCIEAPYRNLNLFESLVKNLSPETTLSVCSNLTAPDELVMTYTVKEWRKKSLPDIHKKPTIFLFVS